MEEQTAAGTGGWTQMGTVGANVTAYSDTGLNCSTAYYYRLRAYKAGDISAYSSVTGATTPPHRVFLPVVLRDYP